MFFEGKYKEICVYRKRFNLYVYDLFKFLCLLLLVKNFINMKWVSVDFFLCEMFFFYLFFWNIFEKVMLYEGRERVMIIGENYVY